MIGNRLIFFLYKESIEINKKKKQKNGSRS